MKKHKEKQARKTRSRVWLIAVTLASAAILAFVVGTLVSGPTAKAQQADKPSQSQTDDEATTVTFANQKIKIDPQTGKLRTPTAEEARAIMDSVAGLTNRSTAGLRVEQAANGGKKMDLQGRFQTVVLGKPNPDGTTEIRCVSTPEEAAAFLGIDPSKLPAKEK
jgi:hypothetical protein